MVRCVVFGDADNQSIMLFKYENVLVLRLKEKK